ncbi:MAG: hypothetical protein L0Z62_37970 [Gemmataceae bacterium]|nr:hypothetical protein [Gemmataceae bacterium]
MKVQFHAVEEFLAEIARDKEQIDRGILRISILRRFHDPFVHLFLLATAVVGGIVVRLDQRLGECFAADAAASAGIGKKGEELMARLGREAEQLGLEVRAGFFE